MDGNERGHETTSTAERASLEPFRDPTPPDRLVTQLQQTGWADVGGFSLTAINQLVEQLGLTTSDVIITRNGEVEVIRRG